MKQLKKITLTLVALLSMTAGAWAQNSDEVTVTPVTGQTNQWEFTMPDADVELTPIYDPEFTAAFKAGNANTIQSGKATVTVKEKDGTTAYTGATLDENGNYKPLYEGQTITLTAATGYKFKSVEVKKGAAPSVPDGAINGKFSVSESKQVYFSKGNLRYASGVWSFFDNQYDYYTSYSADAWDHFGWSTSATTYGMNTSDQSSTYSGDFVDWGATMGTGWFTLSSAEWTYLFNTRSASTVGGTANGRYAKAEVKDVQGVILFPDTYTHPAGVTDPTNVNTASASFDSNTYTVADWTKMESAGCVFLPAAGRRYDSSVDSQGTYGYYWSATTDDDSVGAAYTMFFRSSDLKPASYNSRCNGYSVRLVREVTE